MIKNLQAFKTKQCKRKKLNWSIKNHTMSPPLNVLWYFNKMTSAKWARRLAVCQYYITAPSSVATMSDVTNSPSDISQPRSPYLKWFSIATRWRDMIVLRVLTTRIALRRILKCIEEFIGWDFSCIFVLSFHMVCFFRNNLYEQKKPICCLQPLFWCLKRQRRSLLNHQQRCTIVALVYDYHHHHYYYDYDDVGNLHCSHTKWVCVTWNRLGHW